MKRLDQNGDGKLQPNEVERLNQHLASGNLGRRMHRPGGKGTPPSLSTPKPSTESKDAAKPDAKPAQPKQESKEDEPKDLTKDPFLPKPGNKPPGNFGGKA
jgi:hypothetical protein